MQHDQNWPSTMPPSVIDQASAAELTRLLNKERLHRAHMGGLMPDQPDASPFHDTLDIACGPGAWVMDMAYTYPEMRVVGVDISDLMIGYARTMAHEQRLTNASFSVMDALHPLDFPNESFDLVNAKFVGEFMPKSAWPQFMQECWRVLRPGGVMRITEYEMGVSNSPAQEHLFGLYLRAMFDADRIFSSDGRHLGLLTMLEPFLHRVGFRQIAHRLYGVNYSHGAEMQEEWCQDLMLKVKLTMPFVARMGISTLPELEVMAERMQAEMDSPNFCALWIYMTAFGIKPESAP
jgi:ubiquinone/menaquinone biosynthesis C-methylase UbiE